MRVLRTADPERRAVLGAPSIESKRRVAVHARLGIARHRKRRKGDPVPAQFVHTLELSHLPSEGEADPLRICVLDPDVIFFIPGDVSVEPGVVLCLDIDAISRQKGVSPEAAAERIAEWVAAVHDSVRGKSGEYPPSVYILGPSEEELPLRVADRIAKAGAVYRPMLGIGGDSYQRALHLKSVFEKVRRRSGVQADDLPETEARTRVDLSYPGSSSQAGQTCDWVETPYDKPLLSLEPDAESKMLSLGNGGMRHEGQD